MTQPNLTPPIAVNIPNTLTLQVSHEQFVDLALANRDLQLERTATGELIIMPPTGSDTGNKNLDIEGQLWLWNRQTKLGKAFNSSTGFRLPNGANRSPDAAWVSKQRWDALTLEQQETFAPICPGFVLELRSKTDSLEKLQAKMREYIENGAGLGWLIDRKNQRVEIYRRGRNVEVLDHPVSLSGEDVLPGFVLDLTEVWI
ncbi:Uma2 family endonuclease [Nodularia spumigena]|uniref:Uma2 family endonuclease n=1 Tax=Nodularia spumigena TaxID=70799 RepID=UPI00232CEDB8|nr:Uma2 family endonuclease [Nodularia spumigena]MDB9317180.1 Uma2 family endonuclease [Nodularia spumigena CS-590/01A]MDB9327306.1 Uma2 family endonuclease [Nodularia spumigena CS-590/02]MDB9334583.1 Uma2 family endonuclease [Nodularia spumigena CS-590/01]